MVFGEGQPITAAQASAILEALDRNPTEIKASVAGVLERFGFVSAPRRHPPAPPQPPAPTPPASRVRQMVRRSEAARERGEKLPDIVEKALSEQAEAS